MELNKIAIAPGHTEGMEWLCYYFGTYTCPECKERIPVFSGMEEYFLT